MAIAELLPAMGTTDRADALNRISGDAKGARARNVRYLCPYGCRKADCDTYGYCKHLLGFTNYQAPVLNDPRGIQESPVGLVYEPIRQHYRFNGKGEPFATDLKMVTCLEVCNTEPGDVLVNPERIQEDNGYKHYAKELVTSYVFRQNVKETPQGKPAPLPVSEEHRLRLEHDEYRRRVEKRRLALEIAQFKHQLGEHLSDEELELIALETAQDKGNFSQEELKKRRQGAK